MKLKNILRTIENNTIIIITNGMTEIYRGKNENLSRRLNSYLNYNVVIIEPVFNTLKIYIDTFEGVLW